MRESVVPYGGGDYEIRKGRLSDSLLAEIRRLPAAPEEPPDEPEPAH